MTKTAPSIAFPSIETPATISIKLPKKSFQVNPCLNEEKLEALGLSIDNLLYGLLQVLGYYGKMTVDTQEDVLDRLLAPFTTSMKNILMARIEKLAEPDVFTKENAVGIYKSNQTVLSEYLLGSKNLFMFSNGDYSTINPKMIASYDVSAQFVKDINDFYEELDSVMADAEPEKMANIISDTICQNIMLFHLGTILIHFSSKKFDQFVKEKTVELIAYLDQKMLTHTQSHHLKIGSIFLDAASPTSVADRKMESKL
ncbi:MAG: hypothetical protein V4496_02105 [Pseudomonadota bacterium]